MPEENKIKQENPKVDLDTSGPEVDVTLPEEVKEEEVVETKEQETVKEVEEEVKEEPVKEDDSKLEEYSKGVQSRIAKLTRKMREAERREGAAVEYAQALESQRKEDQSRFQKMDTDYWSRFEKNVKTGMESAQKELAGAIESGDAAAQVEANKRIASLAFENAKLEQKKQNQLNRNLYNYQTVEDYHSKLRKVYRNLILKQKLGLVKTHGLAKIEP